MLSASECKLAAKEFGMNSPIHAGKEWTPGCLIHGGNVYYSPYVVGAAHSQPTDEYICRVNISTGETKLVDSNIIRPGPALDLAGCASKIMPLSYVTRGYAIAEAPASPPLQISLLSTRTVPGAGTFATGSAAGAAGSTDCLYNNIIVNILVNV